MKIAQKSLAAAALAVAFAISAQAQTIAPFQLTFDTLSANADAGTDPLKPIELTIDFGIFAPVVDSFGDIIPGSEAWRADPDEGPVTVLNPATVGWGIAPSPLLALDARFQPVVLVFTTRVNLPGFSTVLDNSTLGDLTPASVQFYGDDNALLLDIPINRSQPGFTVNAGAINGVKTVVLPSGAFYDNIAVVPEPSAVLSLIGGLGLLLNLRRRRR